VLSCNYKSSTNDCAHMNERLDPYSPIGTVMADTQPLQKQRRYLARLGTSFSAGTRSECMFVALRDYRLPSFEVVIIDSILAVSMHQAD